MLEHHIQRSIIKQLSTVDSMRFSELQPDDVENKAFDYHLKLLIRDKLVIKNEAGEYELTPFGRKLGISAGGQLSERVERAFSALFLVVRDPDGRWLLYRRLSHPLIDKVGFMHARPVSDETVTDTASRTLREKTGLIGDFGVRAHGYFRIFEDGALESFTHFTILVAERVSGELEQKDDLAHYAWHENPDFSAEEMLPNMVDIVELLSDPSKDFLEKTYRLRGD